MESSIALHQVCKQNLRWIPQNKLQNYGKSAPYSSLVEKEGQTGTLYIWLLVLVLFLIILCCGETKLVQKSELDYPIVQNYYVANVDGWGNNVNEHTRKSETSIPRETCPICYTSSEKKYSSKGKASHYITLHVSQQTIPKSWQKHLSTIEGGKAKKSCWVLFQTFSTGILMAKRYRGYYLQRTSYMTLQRA